MGKLPPESVSEHARRPAHQTLGYLGDVLEGLFRVV